jgi:hypothetical protein
MDSLRYTLNGGESILATIGPTYNARLNMVGDFNLEIAIEDLNLGTNYVYLTAVDSLGNQTDQTVIINYENSNTWPLPYSISWETTAGIQEVAQIVDGLWALEGNGLRTVEPGYDRNIAIGDMVWDNYEVTVAVTVHWIDENWTSITDSPLVGIICRWQGHTQDGKKPSNQWWPLGTLAAYHWEPYDQFQMSFVDYAAKDNSGLKIDLGTQYVFKLRAETIAGVSTYKFKVWRSVDPEPAEWLMTETEGLHDLETGSILLVVHHADVSIGEISIVPLP